MELTVVVFALVLVVLVVGLAGFSAWISLGVATRASASAAKANEQTNATMNKLGALLKDSQEKAMANLAGSLELMKTQDENKVYVEQAKAQQDWAAVNQLRRNRPMDDLNGEPENSIDIGNDVFGTEPSRMD